MLDERVLLSHIHFLSFLSILNFTATIINNLNDTPTSVEEPTDDDMDFDPDYVDPYNSFFSIHY